MIHGPTLQMRQAATTEAPDALQVVLQLAQGMANPCLADLERRGQDYLSAGYPLHLRGPATDGKTTLALRLTDKLERPIVSSVGYASFDTSRLAGNEPVRRARRVTHRYVNSVIRVENQTSTVWRDRALAMACTEGGTLVSDEFSRAPPGANNALLSVLEERVLVPPNTGETCMPVHQGCRAIFTSNSADHVGSDPTQVALTDRIITPDLDIFRRETELDIVLARSGLEPTEVRCIIDIVRDFRASREYAHRPTLRASIMIARIAAERVELGRRVEAALAGRRVLETAAIVADLAPLGERDTELHLLDENMIPNRGFLVRREHEAEFDTRVQAIAARLENRVILRYVGPLPRYSFARWQTSWLTGVA